MPIIDVSQKSYRSLVKAAHKLRMSIDRFIQQPFESSASEVKIDKESVLIQFSASPRSDSAENQAPRRHRAIPSSSIESYLHIPFDNLWKRIKERAGHSISTKRGQDFTYKIESEYLMVIESGVRIPKSQFNLIISRGACSQSTGIRKTSQSQKSTKNHDSVQLVEPKASRQIRTYDMTKHL